MRREGLREPGGGRRRGRRGLAGGVPIGATVTRAEILDSLKKGEATSTFGGNPLACAAGTATLRYILDNDLPSQAKKKGKLYLDKLKAMGKEHQPHEGGEGARADDRLRLRVDIQELLNEAMSMGAIFTYSGRTILRMLPPLVITERHSENSVKTLGTPSAPKRSGAPAPVAALDKTDEQILQILPSGL